MAIGIKSFEMLWHDTVMCSVTVKNDVPIKIEQFCHPNLMPAIFINDKQSLITFFKNHTFDENRPDMKELLQLLGLNYYNPYLMCRKLHGIQCGQPVWLRFEDDTIQTFNEAMQDIQNN